MPSKPLTPEQFQALKEMVHKIAYSDTKPEDHDRYKRMEDAVIFAWQTLVEPSPEPQYYLFPYSIGGAKFNVVAQNVDDAHRKAREVTRCGPISYGFDEVVKINYLILEGGAPK
jgi:hypothetical protein